MRVVKYILPLTMIWGLGCIGDDFVNDFVQPQLRITNPIDTLAINETYQLEVVFFNNVGQPEGINIKWSSDNEEVAMVSEGGLLWARVKGNTTVTAIAEYEGETVTVEKNVVVDQETVAAEKERKGSLRSTSTYNLKGDFILTENEGGVTLSFSEDYKTDDVLPGLFIYLTNNPSTIKDALEISEVTTFDGAHSYDILDVKLNDYSHVLYFCKPFNVKVGDGALE